jgi:hypothetical protein
MMIDEFSCLDMTIEWIGMIRIHDLCFNWWIVKMSFFDENGLLFKNGFMWLLWALMNEPCMINVEILLIRCLLKFK